MLRRYMDQYRFQIVALEHLMEVFRASTPKVRLVELEESIHTPVVPVS